MRTDVDLTRYNPQIIMTMTQADGETLVLTNSDFVANSLKFRSASSETGEITVGAAIIGSCNFRVWNDTGKLDAFAWTNATVDVTLKFSDEAKTEIYMGKYFIVSHTVSGQTVSVESLDYLKLLDEHQLYELNVDWPIDAVDLARQLVLFGTSNFYIDGLSDADRGILLYDPGFDTMTNREALSYVAQVLGKYVAVKHTSETDNSADFRWYDTETVHDAGTTFDHQLRTGDITVTGVTVTADDTDDTTEERGDDTYKLIISDNPFIDANNVSAVADRIYSAVNGLTFRPGDFAISSTPALEAGDTITINTSEETGVKTIATNVTYCPSSVKMRVTAEAEAADGDLQITRATYIRRVIKDSVKKYSGGAGVGGGLDPDSIYKLIRPTDWLEMPRPSANQAYFLYLISAGDTEPMGLAFTQSTTSEITVETGTIDSGRFISMTSDIVGSYGLESKAWVKSIYSATYGNETSDGFCQVMVRITGENITRISANINMGSGVGGAYMSPVEIRTNGIQAPNWAPGGTLDLSDDGIMFMTSDDKIASVRVGAETYIARGFDTVQTRGVSDNEGFATSLITTDTVKLYKINSGASGFKNCSNLKYCKATITNDDINALGLSGSEIVDMNETFRNCKNLIETENIDIYDSTHSLYIYIDASSMFAGCESLIKPGALSVGWMLYADYMFKDCSSLMSLTKDKVKARQITKCVSMFENCSSLRSVGLENLNAEMTDTFKNCSNLQIVNLTLLVNAKFTDTTFSGCSNLRRLTVSGTWGGGNINLADASRITRSSLVTLFDSLPAVTNGATITLHSSAYRRLSDDDIAVATGKGYTVTT